MTRIDFQELALELAIEAEKEKETKSIEYAVLKRLLIASSSEGDRQDMARIFLELLGDKQCLAADLIDLLKVRLEGLKQHIKIIEQQREINRLAGKNRDGGSDE